MSANVFIATAIAVSTPVALYVAFRRGVIQHCIGVVKSKLCISGTMRKYVDDKVEDLRRELAILREHMDRCREKVELLESRLRSLEEKVELIDKRVQPSDTYSNEEDDIMIKVVELRKKGYSLKKIAEELGISLSKVRKILKLKSGTAD